VPTWRLARLVWHVKEEENRIMPTAPGAHPHFNDRGALKWYTSLPEGLVAAKAERKKVFIERVCAPCPERRFR